MNDHLCAALVATSGNGGAGTAFHNPVEEFGHFVNATLFQETRIFIIATLKGNRKSRWNNITTLRAKVTGNRDEIMSQH